MLRVRDIWMLSAMILVFLISLISDLASAEFVQYKDTLRSLSRLGYALLPVFLIVRLLISVAQRTETGFPPISGPRKTVLWMLSIAVGALAALALLASGVAYNSVLAIVAGGSLSVLFFAAFYRLWVRTRSD